MIAYQQEKKLLRTCARYPLKSWNPDDVSRLLGSQLDWDYLLRTAGYHGLAPLLFRALTDSRQTGQAPPDVIEKLKASYLASLMRNEQQLRNFADVLESFSEKEIPVMLLKGPALCRTVYDDMGLRPFGDIDFLVPREKLDLSKSLLDDQGYRLLLGNYFPIPDERNEELGCEWNYEKNGYVIELHWGLINKLTPLDVDLSLYWRNTREIEVEGRPALIMGPESEFMHLCLHQFKHHWEHLRDLTDIALIVERLGEEINWPAVANAARKQGLERCVYFNLYLVEKVLGTPSPYPSAVDLLRSSGPGRTATAVSDMIAENILERHLPRRFWELLLVDGRRPQAAIIAGILRHPFHREDDLRSREAASEAKPFKEKLGAAFRSILFYRGLVFQFFRRLVSSKPF